MEESTFGIPDTETSVELEKLLSFRMLSQCPGQLTGLPKGWNKPKLKVEMRWRGKGKTQREGIGGFCFSLWSLSWFWTTKPLLTDKQQFPVQLCVLVSNRH